MTTVIFSPVQGLMWPTIELRVGRKGYEHSRVGLTRDDVGGGVVLEQVSTSSQSLGCGGWMAWNV